MDDVSSKPSRFTPAFQEDERIAGKKGPAPVHQDHLKMEVEQVYHHSPKKELS